MTKPLRLFQGFGVELEYMIVDQTTLDVRPICDRLLAEVAGEAVTETELGDTAWSNELMLHVVELKTNGPAPTLTGVASKFQADIARLNGVLRGHDACVMPAAMHPWMDPTRESRIWPHEYSTVYHTFDRIFGCTGHGWSNIQATHLNLPFGDDHEFGQLHAAIRLVLPLLPALAASSPVAEGKVTGQLDTRLGYYWDNARKVPSVSGSVVPEAVFTRSSYESTLLGQIYGDLAGEDPAGILRHEWVNARGAIARFDRSAIEIRLLDIQECPAADLAILGLVTAVVKALVAERWTTLADQQAWSHAPLAAILRRVVDAGEKAVLDQAEPTEGRYLESFGFTGQGRVQVKDLWHHVAEQVLRRDSPEGREWWPALDVILQQGPLARRLIRALGDEPSRGRLADVWRELCHCLAEGRLFAA